MIGLAKKKRTKQMANTMLADAGGLFAVVTMGI